MTGKATRKRGYAELAEDLRAEIRRGAFESGEKLPTHREMVEKYEVNTVTLQRALGVLEKEGWVVSRRSVGVFVKGVPEGSRTASDDLARRVNDLAATVEDLRGKVQQLEQAVVVRSAGDLTKEADDAVDRGTEEPEQPGREVRSLAGVLDHDGNDGDQEHGADDLRDDAAAGRHREH